MIAWGTNQSDFANAEPVMLPSLLPGSKQRRNRQHPEPSYPLS